MDSFTQRMLWRASSWRERRMIPEHRAALMRAKSCILKAVNIDFEGGAEQKGEFLMAEQLLLADEVCEVEAEEEQFSELSSDVSYNVESFLESAIGEELENETQPVRRASLPESIEAAGDESDSPFITVKKYRTATQLARQKLRPVLPALKQEPSSSAATLEARRKQHKESLKYEVYAQKVLMQQCSKALGLCKTTREFHSSLEHVEAERGLLLASHRYRAAQDELERVETCRSSWEKGSVTISDIMLPLKKTLVAEKSVLWFLCLASHGKQVLATRAIQGQQHDELHLKETLHLTELPRHFEIILEVYSLRLRRTDVPLEVRYHIEQSQDICPAPFRLPHRDAQLEFSPYTKVIKPLSIHTPAFSLIGNLQLRIADLHVRGGRTFSKVPLSSPLAGDIYMDLHSSVHLGVEHSGFLSVKELGCWQRYWCCLSGHVVNYWKYPCDQQDKPPVGQVDLCYCVSEKVGPVDQELCARPRTLILVTSRQEDFCSTVNITRHLWQADTRAEMTQWCSKLTDVVSALRRWNVPPPRTETMGTPV